MQITDLAFIDSTGYHFADYPSFLAWLQDAYRAIYGADTYLESDSQDGQFLAVLAKAFYDTAALGASVYNSFSPVTAQGLGLARVVKINGLTKRVATKSTVDLTVVGQSGTVITNGIAIDVLKQKWLLPLTTIPISGTVTVTAEAENAGNVNAEAATVTQIFTPTLGWQTVNNVAAATPGEPIETDGQLRVRQQQSTANPSLTVLDGTVGGVANVSGVTKARGYENDTGSTDSNGLPAHSIAIIALGGNAVAVAQEIALHKTPGTRTYGTTSETVYDAHDMPLAINFYRPTSVTIKVQITIATNAAWSSGYADLIKQAIADVIDANKIGADVLINKLFQPAFLNGSIAGQSYDVVSLEIGKNSNPLGVVNIPLAFNENAVCSATADVTVIVT